MAKTVTKKETVVEQKEFNKYEYVKSLLIKAKFAGENEIKMRSANGDVLSYLQSVGAIDSFTVDVKDTNVDENGIRYCVIKVENINLGAQAVSKRTGNKYYVFPVERIGFEYLRNLK